MNTLAPPHLSDAAPRRVAVRPAERTSLLALAGSDTHAPPRRVCLLGFNDRAGLNVLRSLARIPEVEVDVVTDQPQLPALRSRHCRSVFCHVPLRHDAARARSQILTYLSDQRSLLLPVTDAYLQLISRDFESLAAQHVLPYSNRRSLENAVDKQHVLELAQAAGIATPQTILLSRYEDLAEVGSQVEFPCIVKPRFSACWSNNQVVPLKVEKVASLEELELVARLKLPHSDLLIQQYLPGSGHGVNFASHRGQLDSYFEYRRLHEPGFGGGSSLRQSVPADPALRQQCEKLLKRLDYSGIGMVEFRRSGGELYFMEINARVWGSISAPIFCGMDFPAILYAQATGRRQRVREYRCGLTSRHLLKDLAWISRTTIRRRSPWRAMREVSTLAVRSVGRRECLDVESLRDPRPSWEQFRELAGRSVVAVSDRWRRFQFRALRQRYRERCLRALECAEAICFVCRGNVIRSAFAAAYLQTRLAALGGIDRPLPAVYSAGTLDLRGRPAPPHAVRAALRWGVDLSGHRSQSLLPLPARPEHTVWLAMDEVQCRLVQQQVGRGSVFPLSSLLPSGPLRIEDPYRRDYSRYVHALTEIQRCIERMMPCFSQARAT